VIRREIPVMWTNADRAYLAQVMDTDTWKKLMVRCEDSIVADLLGGPETDLDPERIRATVAAKAGLLRYIANHGKSRPVDTSSLHSEIHEEEDLESLEHGPEPDASGHYVDDDGRPELSPIQMSAEEE